MKFLLLILHILYFFVVKNRRLKCKKGVSNSNIMKIILFGSTGMLGNYVKNQLSMTNDIIPITRDQFDIENCDWIKLYNILNKITNSGDIIINCAGVIPQQSDANYRKYIIINTLFPEKLNQYAKQNDLRLIHISTDCVFSGKRGNYSEKDGPDAETIYGITKSLGDIPDICIIRTSIIGDELYNKRGLLEWLKTNKDGEIDGYNGVLWNGITCYQLSKIIEEMIKSGIYWKGVRHIYSPTVVSKYELCKYINEIYGLNIKINCNNEIKKQMTITTIYDDIKFTIPEISIQIKEQYLITHLPNTLL